MLEDRQYVKRKMGKAAARGKDEGEVVKRHAMKTYGGC
jgi:hypothetical protein